MADALQPDPSLIGGVPSAPFAQIQSALNLFQSRARRFAFLAETSELGPYLELLAQISKLQARLCLSLPEVAPPYANRLAQARANGMPPIDRGTLATDPLLLQTLAAVTAGARDFDMPEPARQALEAVAAAGSDDQEWLLANILTDTIPADSAAPHLFAACAVQLHLARLAATLDPAALVPIGTGICPSCGGKPVTSSVMGAQGIENVRYASCSCCATQWNEVRVKCLCCGSTKGISYRSAETHEATVKAETCSECSSWVKILYQVKNASLDPVADDVGSLGLDMMMSATAFRRGGFNPFIMGY